jgi:hypothetical protein
MLSTFDGRNNLVIRTKCHGQDLKATSYEEILLSTLLFMITDYSNR